MKVEDVTDKLDEYFDETCPLLILNIENEYFEICANIRDDIDKKILRVAKYIIKNNLTKLSQDDLIHQLKVRYSTYMKEWYDLFEIDSERRVII